MMVLPCRHRDAEVGLGEAAADAEDHVGFSEELMHRRGIASAAGAERQRMVLRERALALQAGGDRNLEQLGQLLQLVPGLRVVHALAGVDHRPLGVEQQLRGLVTCTGSGAVAACAAPARSSSGSASPRSRCRSGISTRHRPAAAGARRVKARRMMLETSRREVTGSADLVMRCIAALELKLGTTHAQPARIAARHDQHGTDSP